LSLSAKWFAANMLVLNINKTNINNFVSKQTANLLLAVFYGNLFINELPVIWGVI
jgi:hypothetical protein